MAPTVDAKHNHNKRLYNALMSGNENEVIELCRETADGPLRVLTIHNDTVLHMATYSKQMGLVHSLLHHVPEDQHRKLLHQNDVENTILHEAATSDKIVPAAIEMLLKAPELLSKRNWHGETALFRAARYGKTEMFKFLDDRVTNFVQSTGDDYRAFHVRNDKTTILHIAILAEHFDLALLIVNKYEYLVDEKDGDGMTSLQLLACNPSAFQSGSKRTSLKKLFYNCVSAVFTATGKVETCCEVPLWNSMRKDKERCKSALDLVRFLVAKDTSWEDTKIAMDESKPKTHKYGVHQEQEAATRSGCTEIVEEILEMYPQAVEHVDEHGRNILHVAIKYRRLQIFDIVEKMEIPMRRLIRKITNSGNSILHMVGKMENDEGPEHSRSRALRLQEDLRSPALRLQEDLQLFEHVKNISTAHFIKHFNNEKQTAEMLFEKSSVKLRTEAKDWLKRTAENCSIVAVLISTVAFAAAYTIPGGPNQSTGYPLLLNEPFFVIFAMADVLSLAFALTSVITFLSILTSPFQLRDFKKSLPQKLMLGLTLLIFSISMMMFAFAATIILMIRSKQEWRKIALSSVAFLPVTIFVFSYLPLYASLIKSLKYPLKKIEPAFPRFNRDRSCWNSNTSRSNNPNLQIPSETLNLNPVERSV